MVLQRLAVGLGRRLGVAAEWLRHDRRASGKGKPQWVERGWRLLRPLLDVHASAVGRRILPLRKPVDAVVHDAQQDFRIAPADMDEVLYPDGECVALARQPAALQTAVGRRGTQ